jgi:hypothetical protein
MLCLTTAGGSLAAAGGLMLLVGSSSLLPPGTMGTLVPPILLGLGLALVGGPLASGGRRFLEWIRESAPRLYPFAPFGINVLVFATFVIGATTVYHGVFDVISGAHNGGQVNSFQDQDDLTFLLIGGSLIVWVLTLYTVLVVARVIRTGRGLDSLHGTDPYGRRAERPERLPPIPLRGQIGRTGSPADRRVVFAVCLLMMVGISASIQVLEINIGPAPVGDWLASLIVLPAWAGATAATLVFIDRGIRNLEDLHRDAMQRATAPPPVVEPEGARPAGFVH